MPKAIIRKKELHYLDIGEGYPLLFGHSYLWASDIESSLISVPN